MVIPFLVLFLCVLLISSAMLLILYGLVHDPESSDDAMGSVVAGVGFFCMSYILIDALIDLFSWRDMLVFSTWFAAFLAAPVIGVIVYRWFLAPHIQHLNRRWVSMMQRIMWALRGSDRRVRAHMRTELAELSDIVNSEPGNWASVLTHYEQVEHVVNTLLRRRKRLKAALKRARQAQKRSRRLRHNGEQPKSHICNFMQQLKWCKGKIREAMVFIDHASNYLDRALLDDVTPEAYLQDENAKLPDWMTHILEVRQNNDQDGAESVLDRLAAEELAAVVGLHDQLQRRNRPRRAAEK